MLYNSGKTWLVLTITIVYVCIYCCRWKRFLYFCQCWSIFQHVLLVQAIFPSCSLPIGVPFGVNSIVVIESWFSAVIFFYSIQNVSANSLWYVPHNIIDISVSSYLFYTLRIPRHRCRKALFVFWYTAVFVIKFGVHNTPSTTSTRNINWFQSSARTRYLFHWHIMIVDFSK